MMTLVIDVVAGLDRAGELRYWPTMEAAHKYGATEPLPVTIPIDSDAGLAYYDQVMRWYYDEVAR
jgi:hypothetical protein